MEFMYNLVMNQSNLGMEIKEATNLYNLQQKIRDSHNKRGKKDV